MEQRSLLEVGHVGAARDTYSWDVSRPGLYFLVGEKGAGKTTITRVLGLLAAAPEDLSTAIPISHGEDRAWIGLDARRLEVSLSPAGVAREPLVSGGEVSVEEVPNTIRTLVDGDRCVGKDTRAEHRLAALLSYAPVPTTPERLDELLRCLRTQVPGRQPGDRAFADPGTELRDLWRDLAAAHAAGKGKAKKAQPLMTPGEIRAWLEALGPGKRNGGILHDHALLFGRDGLLNSLMLTGNRALAEQDRRRAEIEGRLQQAAKDAAQRAGVERLSTRRLETEYDLPALIQVRDNAKLAAQRIRDRAADRGAEERRREAVRAKLAPERPGVDVARRDELLAQIEPAEKALAEAIEEEQGACREVETVGVKISEASRNVSKLYDEWADFTNEVAGSVYGEFGSHFDPSLAGSDDPEEIRWGAILHAERSKALLIRLEEALRDDPRPLHGRAVDALDKARPSRRRAKEELDRLKADFAIAQADVERQEREQRRWDELTAELDVPLPEVGDLTAAEAALAEADVGVRIAEAAVGYQALAAEHKRALEVAADLDAVVKDYQKAKAESWGCLGQVVTDALKLPWLQVDGTEIFFGFGPDGKLNLDSSAIEAAKAAAQRAIEAATDPASPIPAGRFLERVREESTTVTWRNIDDNEMSVPPKEGGYALSEGELAHSCLELWFSRQQTGAVRTLPTAISATFDEATERATSKRAIERGMRFFGSRPRRSGDPEGLHLVWVDPDGGES